MGSRCSQYHFPPIPEEILKENIKKVFEGDKEK